MSIPHSLNIYLSWPQDYAFHPNLFIIFSFEKRYGKWKPQMSIENLVHIIMTTDFFICQSHISVHYLTHYLFAISFIIIHYLLFCYIVSTNWLLLLSVNCFACEHGGDWGCSGWDNKVDSHADSLFGTKTKQYKAWMHLALPLRGIFYT
jgi:hypothetical protein